MTRPQPGGPGRVRPWLIAALACVAVFGAVAAGVSSGSPRLAAFDVALTAWLRSGRSPEATLRAVDLTALGSSSVVTLATLIGCALLALRRDLRAALHLAAASAGAGLLTRFIKHGFDRPRPADLPPLAHSLGSSFPSGHALMTAALCTTLAVLACRAFARRRERAAVLCIAALATLLVGATRVYLGVHHPSDVLAGMAAGSAWACLLAAAFGPRPGAA